MRPWSADIFNGSHIWFILAKRSVADMVQLFGLAIYGICLTSLPYLGTIVVPEIPSRPTLGGFFCQHLPVPGCGAPSDAAD